ncbi:hypothetical protein FS842_009153 [Serendipita sp. 407]|nr:hypothetical protein FS842_009153 [Serendipita sp. 407]
MASPTISSPLSSVSSTHQVSPSDDLVPDVPDVQQRQEQEGLGLRPQQQRPNDNGGDREEQPVQLHHLQLQWHQEQLQREQLLNNHVSATGTGMGTSASTTTTGSISSSNSDNVGADDANANTSLSSSSAAAAGGAGTGAGVSASMPTNRFIPYHCPPHNPCKGRYITSNDPRGPVYEYPLNGQWIMMDMDDGYILWTGIWKALGNHKADIVKMLESQPELANQLRRVRGGYLKIQGTWLAYEVALRLARRVAWPIRHDLVPLFGPTFPTTCLAPDQPGYGTVIPPTGRRKPRRSLQSVGIPPPHTAPYPPKLPLAKEYAQHQQLAGLSSTTRSAADAPPVPPLVHYHQRQAPHPVLSTSSPIDNSNGSSSPFAHPTVPSVPALVPVSGVIHSPQEITASSQYSTSPATYSPLYEVPMKHRYSPYVFPRRHHSPSMSAYGLSTSPPSSYEPRPRTLVHHSSAPNLRAYPGRNHMLIPRLAIGGGPQGQQQHLPAREIKRALPSMSSAGSEYPMETGTEDSFHHPSQEGLGVTSSDSAPSAIPTGQFNELAPVHEAATTTTAAWHQLPPQNVEVGYWPETSGEYAGAYDQMASYHYDTPTTATSTTTPSGFTDPSNSSPRTAWSSYDPSVYAYGGGGSTGGRHSPPEQHLHYRPSHHHYHSSVSSMASFLGNGPPSGNGAAPGSGSGRRPSMAESLASSFPEPEMPVPTLVHRYSQPQLYQPIPPPHLDYWTKERSGSFAEPSYMSLALQQHHFQYQQQQQQQQQQQHNNMTMECLCR